MSSVVYAIIIIQSWCDTSCSSSGLVLSRAAPETFLVSQRTNQPRKVDWPKWSKETAPSWDCGWSTLDHVSPGIFLVVASELVALSRLFSTICPPELNNGVCMGDNGVGITKEHYWRLLGGDGGVVHCGVVWCGVVWCGTLWWWIAVCDPSQAGLVTTGLQAALAGPVRRRAPCNGHVSFVKHL